MILCYILKCIILTFWILWGNADEAVNFSFLHTFHNWFDCVEVEILVEQMQIR